MKDREIFELFEQSTGISKDKISDYRPCSSIYNETIGIPFVKNAITVELIKDGGTIIYIPKKDAGGNGVSHTSPREFLYDGDIFALPNGKNNDACVVTTNGIVKTDGRAVMGAGIAKYCRDTFCGCDSILGARLKESGNHVHKLDRYAIPRKDGLFTLISFPTKNDWRDNSSIELIRQSCREILEMANIHRFDRIYMPCPGCTNGHLDYWKDVRPVLAEELDNRFVICVPDRIRNSE